MHNQTKNGKYLELPNFCRIFAAEMTNMGKYLCFLFSVWLMFCSAGISVADTCPVKKIEAERLPDMNIPRAGHQMFYVGDELTVFGGHTNGFVPTPTAEYFKDGEWHVMPMTYNHDFGIAVVLKSGKVLLAGGAEQATGIGQTFTSELYDSETHTFRGFGNMQQKRVLASALELDSGQVVIAGNWYNTDGIELFSEDQSMSGDYLGKSSFTYIRDVAAERSTPFIFRVGRDDALILGTNDTRGNMFRCTFADRLKSDTVHIPLFEIWQPLKLSSHHDETSLIGDATRGDFTYLLPVQDSTGQVAIAKVNGTDIVLLKTATSVPMHYQGNAIEYYTNIIVDRESGQAYLVGIDNAYHRTPGKVRLYVLCIDYAQASEAGGAPMTLYYTDSLNITPDIPPLLTPEGNLLIAGGLIGNSNYNPSAAVWLLRTGREPVYTASNFGTWLWIMLAAVALVIVCLLLFLQKRNYRHNDRSTAESREFIPMIPDFSADATLMRRISQLMESERLFLNPDLKLSDLATALGTNRNYISDCINSQGNGSFTQFVNTYRIEYAQRLMQQQPDMKISEVWTASGFSTERTFLRTFKAFTGMTPSEWKNKEID